MEFKVRVDAIDTLILSNPNLIDLLISSKSRTDKAVLAGFAYYILEHGGNPGNSEIHSKVNSLVMDWLINALKAMHQGESPNKAFAYSTKYLSSP